jgi:hypothetical protein
LFGVHGVRAEVPPWYFFNRFKSSYLQITKAFQAERIFLEQAIRVLELYLLRGEIMIMTTLFYNGFLGGSAAIILIFTCELIASLMQSKEHECVTSEKGNNQ